MHGTKILFLEDNQLYQETIKDFLEEEHFIVDTCSDGEEFFTKTYNNLYDLYILDINVPRINGFEIMKILTEHNDQTMRLVLTSRPDSSITSFKSGCDGYLNKTTDLDELLLRIQSLIKRSYRTYNSVISINEEIEYHIFEKMIYKNNKPLELESKALLILDYLLKKREQFVNTEELEVNVYPSNSESKMGVLRYHIWTLRKTIGAQCIESQKSRGYRLKPLV